MDFFIELLEKIWNVIKKIFVAIINFAKNIVNYFKNPSRLKKLQEDSNRIAVAIKENLDNGDYKVVNCLFDKAENQIVDVKDAQGISADNIDEETKNAFGDKSMIVLQ